MVTSPLRPSRLKDPQGESSQNQVEGKVPRADTLPLRDGNSESPTPPGVAPAEG